MSRVKPLLVRVEVGNIGIACLEKASPDKIEAGTEQVVSVLTKTLPVQFLPTLELWIVSQRFFFFEPFNDRALALR